MTVGDARDLAVTAVLRLGEVLLSLARGVAGQARE